MMNRWSFDQYQYFLFSFKVHPRVSDGVVLILFYVFFFMAFEFIFHSRDFPAGLTALM